MSGLRNEIELSTLAESFVVIHDWKCLMEPISANPKRCLAPSARVEIPRIFGLRPKWLPGVDP